MNHKLTFILPRVAAVTLAAGLGALVLFLVFKLLLVVLAVAGVVVAVKLIAGAIGRGKYGYEDDLVPAGAGITPLRESGAIVPVAVRTKPVIIPIN